MLNFRLLGLKLRQFLFKPLELLLLLEGELGRLLRLGFHRRRHGCRIRLCRSTPLGKLGSLLFLQRLPFAIVSIIARIVLQFAIALHHKQMVHHLVHEVAVVAHHNHAAAEVLQILLQHLQGDDVKVVGRFVENQEVGRTHQDGAKVEPSLLPATELIDVRILLVRREEELLQELRGRHLRTVAHQHVFGYVAHHIDHLLLLVVGDAVLAVVAEAHRLAHLETAFVGLQFAQKKFQVGRFARSVGTDDAHLLVTCECIVVVLQDHLGRLVVAKCLAHVLCHEDLRADVGAACLQSHALLLIACLGALLEFVECLDARTALVSACLGLTAHPVQFLA